MTSPRARLFVAIDLPAQTRSEIEEWGRKALADPALRRVAAGSLHITLAFLGYRPEEEIGAIAEIVEATEAPAVRAELHGPVARPSGGGRARLFALGVESPEAVALQADLAARLASERLYEPEERPFWPHLTVARVRPGGSGSKRPRSVESVPEPLPHELLRPISCVRVALYRSELKPQGAQYTRLAQVELSQAGRQ